MGFEEIMRGASKVLKPATKEQSESFKHIEGLKAGDLVQLKRGQSIYVHPRAQDVCMVYSMYVPAIKDKNDDDKVCREDFTVLFEAEDSGTLIELSLDSRYFERVETK